MSPSIVGATAARILRQLGHDPRTIALIMLAPSLLLFLLRYVFDDARLFDALAPALIAIFPFVVLFLVTSMATLRERRSGTLERLMTLPAGKIDLLAGYAVAFGAVAAGQVAIITGVALWLGLDVPGSIGLVALVALLDALLGVALGLLASAFARTEFQVTQFMPAVVMPQVLLCGLFTPRDQMHPVLEWVSAVMPLSYAVDAINAAVASSGGGRDLVVNAAVVAGCAVLFLVLGAVTLRRRTP